ncbi:hypothetical protein Hanom_Chr15g01405451 [Helianthus anomalus]
MTSFKDVVKFLRESRFNKALTDRTIVYESHVRMFWKSLRYEEKERMIYSAIQKRDENDKKVDVEIKFNVGDLRRVLDLGDTDDHPTIVSERLCKGLWCRMGFEGNVNGKFLKSMFSRPYKFLIHCIVHALSHRKGAYDEPSDYIMNIITCLVLNRPYNISQVLFNHLIDNIRGEKYIIYPSFIQMIIDDQVTDLRKDPADVMNFRNMTSDTLKRLNQYKLKKEETKHRAKHKICKIANPRYVAPENEAWRHDNSNSEDETDRLRDMHEKKLRYWFVKDGKRKRTLNASPTVIAPKVPTPKIVVKCIVKRGSHKRRPSKKSPPRLVDEPVLDPSDVLQQGNEEATATQGTSVEKIDESAKHIQPEGVVHSDSSDADDESTDTEQEIDMSKKKRKGSDEDDSTYMPTAEEKKKLRTKRKAVQFGDIPRNVRAKKGGATRPESQSGKKEKHVISSKGPEAVKDQNIEVPEVPEVQSQEYVRIEKKGVDDAETSWPKKTTLLDLFEGFPNVHGEYTDDILIDEENGMFYDETIKDLKKKVSILEKEKAKAEADRYELKKQLEELSKINEEINLS